jgi:hypothetical protein
MPNPLRDLFFGTVAPKKELVEALTPRRTFHDVILPASTRRALDFALSQIKKHDLIFHHWGLGERHSTGRGLAFNFAGPPGTGKTICAEAIANALGKKLLVVRYSEVESLWAGETGKNVSAVFRAAAEHDAVLFFDEADAIASRRFSSITQGYQREANAVVNVLLKELEEFDGVVIFATNLAANFDPAFERRIRTHILFEMPGAPERAEIWKVQLHARKTPLADDVNFEELGEKFAASGGDIKNAVLKAAQMATAEPGADENKQIHQRHFEIGMQEVMAAKKVMEQSLFEGDGSAMPAGLNGYFDHFVRAQEGQGEQLEELTRRIGETEQATRALPGIVERFDDAARASQNQLRADLSAQIGELSGQLSAIAQEASNAARENAALRETLAAQLSEHQSKLDDLWTRLEKERETQTQTVAQWKTQMLIAWSVGGAGLVTALAALAMTMRG